MKSLNKAERISFSKSLVHNQEIIKKDFLSYLSTILGDKKLEEVKFSLNDMILEYLIIPSSLNKQYKKFEKLDSEVLDFVLHGYNYPKITELIQHLKKIHIQQNGFSIIDFIWLLNSFALSRLKEGEKPFVVQAPPGVRERAENQTKRLLKKDLNGLLGVEKLFTKEPKKKPRHYPRSVWTVKIR
jgi:hypothetical protein